MIVRLCDDREKYEHLFHVFYVNIEGLEPKLQPFYKIDLKPQ